MTPADRARMIALVEKLEELAKDATPGPWTQGPRPADDAVDLGSQPKQTINLNRPADAAFIAAARTAVPALCAALREADAAVAFAREEGRREGIEEAAQRLDDEAMGYPLTPDAIADTLRSLTRPAPSAAEPAPHAPLPGDGFRRLASGEEVPRG